MRKITSLLVGGVLCTSVLTVAAGQADDDADTYKITITNLTPGQPIAPVMAAT